jgi:hypothetical protein
MPEWQLLIAALTALGLVGLLWTPLLIALPLAIGALGATVVQAIVSARRAPRRGLTALLHFLQPIARMQGRARGGLTPWRRRGLRQMAVPRPRTTTEWSGEPAWGRERLEAVEKKLRVMRAPVGRGGEYERWDLEVRGGLLGSARMRMAVEEHEGSAKLVRVRSWPRWSIKGAVVVLVLVALALGAAVDGAWAASTILAFAAAGLVGRALAECAAATAGVLDAVTTKREITAPAVGEAEVSEA